MDKQQKPKAKPTCSAPACSEVASAEVILYDVYMDGEVFFERDKTCPYLCEKHLAENEASAVTKMLRYEAEDMIKTWLAILDPPAEEPEEPVDKRIPVKNMFDLMHEPDYVFPPLRRPRGSVEYTYTNRNNAQGFTIYRPLP
jgi:hypothetical protein